MFTLFFSHLTTTISELEVYFFKSKTTRSIIPKDFHGFRRLSEKVKASMIVANEELETKTPGYKATEDLSNEMYQNELAGCEVFKVPEMDLHEKCVVDMNWSFPTFLHNYKSNYDLMGLPSFIRAHRMSTRRGERFLVMSGLTWNKASQAKARDWAPTVAAVTIETAMVETYRENMLKMCGGARQLREEMREYFLSIATAHFSGLLGTGSGSQKKTEWEFPDGYGLPSIVDTTGEKFDEFDIKKAVDEASAAESKKKKAMSSGNKSVEGLLKNKLLWASGQGVMSGTLETLAYRCIATLSQASRHSFIDLRVNR